MSSSFLFDVKIRIFPISITGWSGFGILKKDWGDPDEIGMVGQSVSIMLDHYFTFIHSTMMT